MNRSEAIKRPCPACKAMPGERCVGRGIKPRIACHAERHNNNKAKKYGCTNKTYLYIIGRSDGCGPVKVGISRSLKTRLVSLQVGNQYKLKILHAFSFKDRASAIRAESIFHETCNVSLLHGEWFDLRHDVAAEIIGGLFYGRN